MDWTGLRGRVETLPRAAWVAATIAMAVLACRDRLPLVRHNHDVGHADEAAYALQARGLVWHGSTRVPYVSTFFRRYDPGIWRHDDHWPAPLGWVMAPAFAVWGVDAAVGRAVCVALGALLLPLATAGLVAACRRRMDVAAALAAGLVLADTLIFQESLRMLADILMTSLLVAFAAAVVAAQRRPRWYWAAGACAAWATLTKGSQLILLGFLPAGAVLLGGWPALRNRKLWGGLAVAVALLLPHWVTFWREYGSPFHSTQNHVSAFYGLSGDWDESFYAVHWDGEPPTLRDRFADLDLWERVTRRNTEVFLRSALLGEEASRADWAALGGFGRWVQRALLDRPAAYGGMRPGTKLPRPWRTALHATALVAGLGLLAAMVVLRLAGPPIRWLARRVRRRARDPAAFPPRERVDPAPQPPAGFALRAAAFVAVLALAQTAFMCLLWSAEQVRFTLVLTPLLASLAAVALATPLDLARGLVRRWTAERWGRRLARAGAVLSATAAAMVAAAAFRWHGDLLTWQRERTEAFVPETAHHPVYHRVAEALAATGVGADAVVMTRNPWELLFYAPDGMRGVGLPYAPPERIFEVARFYGVTHFLFDCNRPGLHRFVMLRRDAFRLVARTPFPLYAIEWEALQ